MQKTLKKLAYLFIIVENSKKMIKFIVKKKVSDTEMITHWSMVTHWSQERFVKCNLLTAAAWAVGMNPGSQCFHRFSVLP